MKKALISAVVLAGFAGMAQAQMTIYGLIDASFGKSNAIDAAGGKVDFHSGGDNGSGEGNSTTRIGFKGSADVGSGVKANFKLESGGITSNGDVNPGGAFFNRQAWMGFSGSLGEVRFGKQDSVAFQTMIDYDFNGASNGVSSGCYAQVAAWGACDIGRQDRSLQYISPSFGGVKIHLGFVPEGNTPNANNTYSSAITYAAGNLSVSATVESARTKGAAKFGSVAGSYDFGAVKVMASYADGRTGVKGVMVGFVAPVAGVNVGALYGKNSDTKGQAWEVFVNKEVLKGTYAYFELGKSDKKTIAPDGTGFAVGVIYTF
jgi:predicted porin